jgi:hypothetical protein
MKHAGGQAERHLTASTDAGESFQITRRDVHGMYGGGVKNTTPKVLLNTPGRRFIDPHCIWHIGKKRFSRSIIGRETSPVTEVALAQAIHKRPLASKSSTPKLFARCSAFHDRILTGRLRLRRMRRCPFAARLPSTEDGPDGSSRPSVSYVCFISRGVPP